MAKIVMVTGGARSGKSSYAQSLAESLPGSRVLIATCPPADQTGDKEMAARILRHQRDREKNNWGTIEEQVDLANAIRKCCSHNTLLIDCLTLWVNNVLFLGSPEAQSEDVMTQKGKEILLACKEHPGTVIFVTNEVGFGIVPERPEVRLYRDMVGRLNQVIASGSDQVVLVVSGNPLYLKNI